MIQNCHQKEVLAGVNRMESKESLKKMHEVNKKRIQSLRYITFSEKRKLLHQNDIALRNELEKLHERNR